MSINKRKTFLTIFPFLRIEYSNTPISDHFVFVSDFPTADQRCLTPKTPDDHEWWCPYGIQIEIIPLPENGGSRKSSASSRKTSQSKNIRVWFDLEELNGVVCRS